MQYTDYRDRISLEDFRKIKKLALADLWGRDGLDKAVVLKLDPQEVDSYPKLPEFAQIKEALISAFNTVVETKTFSEHVNERRNQDLLFRTLRRGILHGKDDRAATRLLEAFADRAMPANTKQETRVVLIREETIHRMESTEQELLGVGYKLIEDGPPPTEEPARADSQVRREIPPGGEAQE